MEYIVVLIPAFEPENALVELVRRFASLFKGVLVIDDGSRKRTSVFNALPTAENIILLRHTENRGKGSALRTGFKEILRRFPDASGVVTVDADGQHLPEDVVRVAHALSEHPNMLTLGVRTFSKGIPFRSILGNLWTCGEFRLLTGCHVCDTQTGLRGIPLAVLPRLIGLPGDRYEYEIRMLVYCVKHLGPPIQIPITTVYTNGNATSHYRPLTDTFLTQKALFTILLSLHRERE